MGKFSKIIKGLLAAALPVMLMAAFLPRTALADSGPVIDRTATGTLSIDLTYNGNSLARGVFNIYHVAELDDSPVLSYTLTDAFKNAADDGLNINAVKSTSEAEKAAQTLARYAAHTAETATLTTTGNAGSPASVSGLALGIYLVVQTGAPSYYSSANPFLVYIPMTNEEGTGWDYAYTAHPKTGYNPPGENTVNVLVEKVWNDSGFESERPTSVQAGLYRNSTLYDTQTLSEKNNWKYTWTGLSAGVSWTVDEIAVPQNYICVVDHSGQNWKLTNTREGVPLSATLNVTKVWKGDDPATRPDSVSVTLLRDGKTYETVNLTAGDGWTYTWAGLEEGHTWSVTESNVPKGYSSAVTSAEGGFTITNTYEKEIADPGVPGAPQTGLIQWPVPVLLGVGVLLIACGHFAGRGKKKYDK